MSPDLRTGMRRRRVVPGTGAALALVGLLVLGGPAAAVAPAAQSLDVTLTVTGTLVLVAVDRPEGDAEATLETRTLVEIEGDLVAVPEALGEPTALSGDEVTVTVEADRGLSRAAAIEEILVAEPGDAARIVAVTARETAASPGAGTLGSAVSGVHALTVLPVYWSAPDSAGTLDALRAAAAGTSQYWSGQSNGLVQVPTDVRGWQPIADPGSCNDEEIYRQALAAHQLSEPEGNQHVLVYFPRRSDCGGWAGLASVGGGYIWLNGSPTVDVMAHEFGHNLGLGHANRATCYQSRVRVPLAALSSCTAQEYGDHADVMGVGVTAVPGNLNTAFADYLGFATVARPPAGADVAVSLQPIGAVAALRSVALPVPQGTVYVDYRPATAPDVGMTAWAGVQVHLRTLAAGYPTTYLLDLSPTTSTPFSSPALAPGTPWAIPGAPYGLKVESLGATAQIRVTPGDTALVSYVTRVYVDLFGRAVDPTGLTTWTSQLATGTPRIAVANSITSSEEFRGSLIDAAYRTYLGREADASGRQFWLARMAGGMTIQQLEAGFVASDEYHARAGSDDGWVRRLYADVLGREPSSSEVASWLGAVAAGTRRFDVGLGFLLSTEHLTTAVDAVYLDVLGRSIDPTGRQTWVTAIQAGTRFEQVIGGIVASEEYYRRA